MRFLGVWPVPMELGVEGEEEGSMLWIHHGGPLAICRCKFGGEISNKLETGGLRLIVAPALGLWTEIA